MCGNLIHMMYYDMFNILMRSLINRHKVVLAEIPEILFRKHLDSNLSLPKVKLIFNQWLALLQKDTYDDIRGNDQVENITNVHCQTMHPELFMLPKALYTSSVIKELLERDENIVAFVGNSHYKEIRRRLSDHIHYKNLKMSKYLNEGITPSNDTPEDKVNKQAILDVLTNTYPWSDDQVTNPLWYITDEVDPNSKNGEIAISEEDKTKYHNLYMQTFNEYEQRKREVLEYTANPLDEQHKEIEDQEQQKRQAKLDKARDF